MTRQQKQMITELSYGDRYARHCTSVPQGVINCSLHGQHVRPRCLKKTSLISGHRQFIYLHRKHFSFAIKTAMGRIRQ